MLDGERVTLFLDDDDFAADPAALAAEVVQVNSARSKTPNVGAKRGGTVLRDDSA